MSGETNGPMAGWAQHASAGPSAASTRDALTLFMLWQDTDELARFLSTSHLTADSFKVAPLNRASACELLGVIGIHAHGVGPGLAASLRPCEGDGPLDWESLRSLARLADERYAHTLDADAQDEAWDAATTSAPMLRRTVANDIRVVRLRARWVHLLARDPHGWPQPRPDADAPSPLLASLRKVAHEVAGEDFPARRLWLLPPEGTSSAASPVAVAVEHDGTCPGSEARRLHEGLSQGLGRPVDVMPQDQVHPLLWDSVVPHEQLLWRSTRLCHDNDLVLPAIAHACEHEHAGPHANPHADAVDKG